MKPSSQGCKIGKQYELIDVTTMGSNGCEFIKKPSTHICFSSPPLVWRNSPDAMYTELDYNAICKQCGQKFKDHNKKLEVPACLSKGKQWK